MSSEDAQPSQPIQDVVTAFLQQNTGATEVTEVTEAQLEHFMQQFPKVDGTKDEIRRAINRVLKRRKRS